MIMLILFLNLYSFEIDFVNCVILEYFCFGFWKLFYFYVYCFFLYDLFLGWVSYKVDYNFGLIINM